MEYPLSLSLQEHLSNRVRREPDHPRLLLLCHPPVFTIGKFGDEKNILHPNGIPIHRIDRGGDVTYHGPGQIIGYPILSLRAHRLGVRGYVRRLENLLIGTLSHFQIKARRKEDCVGVWTDRGKIASIGVRVDRGITRHGFACQVKSEPEPYTYINPCGIPGSPVTSVEEELGFIPDEQTFREELLRRFLHHFQFSSSRQIPFQAS